MMENNHLSKRLSKEERKQQFLNRIEYLRNLPKDSPELDFKIEKITLSKNDPILRIINKMRNKL